MSVKDVTTLKTYFSTGQTPTQTQFYALLESLLVGAPGSDTLDGTTAIDAENYTIMRIASDIGNKTISANPQIADGQNGQLLLLIGTSNTDYITLTDNNGLRMNGNFDLKQDYVIMFVYNTTIGDWIEVCRNTTSVSLLSIGIQSGTADIADATGSKAITLPQAYSDTGYSINVNITNTTDANPSQYACTITAKSTTGFTVTFSGDTDSANYKLEWQTIEY